MYLMSSDTCECDICGHREKWDEHDDHRGDMWECENCMTHFCTSCFVKKLGKQAFDGMLQNTDFVLCPECFGKNIFNVKEDALNDKLGLRLGVRVQRVHHELCEDDDIIFDGGIETCLHCDKQYDVTVNHSLDV